MNFFQAKREIFSIPREPFGSGRDERVVEIPWAFSCYNHHEKVLEVGHAFAIDPYIDRLRELPSKLYGVDIVDKKIEGLETVVADSRSLPYETNFFDLIFCISTIEHIGRDNKRIYLPNDPRPIDSEGDIKALQELARVLKKGGEIVITVPYGKFFDYGWFIQYDQERWQKLLDSVQLKKVREDFFMYQGSWTKCEPEALKDMLYQQDGAPAATGLACVLLRK